MTRFYSGQHRFYCGVDLHTRTLSLSVLDSGGAIVCEATLPPKPERLLAALAPYRDGLVAGSSGERRPKRSEAHRAYTSLRFGLR